MTEPRTLTPEEALEALEHWRLVVDAAERWEAAQARWRAASAEEGAALRALLEGEQELTLAVRALHDSRRAREVPQ